MDIKRQLQCREAEEYQSAGRRPLHRRGTMRLRSPECCRRTKKQGAAARAAKADLVWSAVTIVSAGTVSQSTAQETTADVAYVESVNGRVIASLQGSPTLLDVLDVIGERTRLDLPANSELRICHYRARKLLTLKGPLRASVSAS